MATGQFTTYNFSDIEDIAKTGVEEDIIEETPEDTWTILDALNIAVNKINANEVTPAEYFNIIKSQKHRISDKDLNASYDVCLQLADKYTKLGQLAGLKRIGFQLACIVQERKLVKAGITTYVYKDDLMQYFNKITDKSIRICKLRDYEREIPDEVTDVILSVKNIFDDFVIVYTDYTVKEVAKTKAHIERKEKDPIVFGVFTDEKNIFTLDRLYYVADWVDEYCDLTLDKLVMEYTKSEGNTPVRTISTPLTLDEIKEQIKSLEAKGGTYKVSNTPHSVGMFEKIKSFLNR